MAKLTTAQPILIGTATGRSDHRTNTAQLQQTTTLRMCRADLDPPRADGLLRRTVGPAFRARTTHRHRVGNHALKTHPVTSGRDAVTFTRQSRNTFSSVHRRPMSLVQRLGIAAFVVVITGIGLSPAAEAHSAHHHNHHHSRKKKEGLQQGLQAWLQKGHRKQLTPLLRHALPHLFPGVWTDDFTGAPAHHRGSNALDGSRSPQPPWHPGERRTWFQSLGRI